MNDLDLLLQADPGSTILCRVGRLQEVTVLKVLPQPADNDRRIFNRGVHGRAKLHTIYPANPKRSDVCAAAGGMHHRIQCQAGIG